MAFSLHEDRRAFMIYRRILLIVRNVSNVSCRENQNTRFTFNNILRCVISVVLSNNNNKLMVHMYIVKNTTIFLIVRLLLLRYNYIL